MESIHERIPNVVLSARHRIDPGRRFELAFIMAREAAREVGPALFVSLLIITVSFLPVFALEAQEGRLFHPLAFTKTLAMAAAALLSVTVVPALMALFVRGRIVPEHKNPVNRFLIRIYRPIIDAVLKAKAIGAETVATTVEGRERYAVNRSSANPISN